MVRIWNDKISWEPMKHQTEAIVELIPMERNSQKAVLSSSKGRVKPGARAMK